jgi:hypothetical protein
LRKPPPLKATVWLPRAKVKFIELAALGLAWLQVTVLVPAAVELAVSVGAPVIVQVTGEVQRVVVPASVLELPPVARVPVKPVQLMLRTVGLVADQVQVTAPDAAVKNTSSVAPGTV